jgi:hypothetical protein
MAAPYIPNKDSLFDNWINNFADLITASPATYGLTGGDAATIQAQADAWSAAYALAINPATRTKPTVADKDAARAAALSIIRPYAIQIRNNAGVSNMDKADLGLTIPDLTPTPVPPPVTSPTLSLVSAISLQHQLNFRDSAFPLLKRKPVGSTSMQLWRAIGTVAATDPSQAGFYNSITKTPFVSQFDAGDRGKHCTYFARWATRSGAGGIAYYGPWSDLLDVIIL